MEDLPGEPADTEPMSDPFQSAHRNVVGIDRCAPARSKYEVVARRVFRTMLHLLKRGVQHLRNAYQPIARAYYRTIFTSITSHFCGDGPGREWLPQYIVTVIRQVDVLPLQPADLCDI